MTWTEKVTKISGIQYGCNTDSLAGILLPNLTDIVCKIQKKMLVGEYDPNLHNLLIQALPVWKKFMSILREYPNGWTEDRGSNNFKWQYNRLQLGYLYEGLNTVNLLRVSRLARDYKTRCEKHPRNKER